MIKSALRHAAIIIGLALVASPAQAKLPHMPTAAELAVLPEYCQARMGTDPQLRQAWNQRMGPKIFMHLHHYCHGLKDMNRAAIAPNSRERKYHLRTASGQFNYVIERWPADFELTALAKQQRALALGMIGPR